MNEGIILLIIINEYYDYGLGKLNSSAHGRTTNANKGHFPSGIGRTDNQIRIKTNKRKINILFC